MVNKKVGAGTRVFPESFQQFRYQNEFYCCVSLSPSTFYKEVMLTVVEKPFRSLCSI